MKKIRLLLAFLMLFMVQCICSSGGQAPTQPPDEASEEPPATTELPPQDESVGTLDLVNSQVESGPPDNLQYLDGMRNFYNGEGIRVTSGGKGKLSLNDGTRLTLFNDTQVSGVNLTASPREVDLLLQRQGFLGNVPPGGNTVIHTPNGASIVILGTNFFVLFNEQTQVTTAGNFDGTILFTPPGGGQQTLNPGELVDIDAAGGIFVDIIRFTPLEFEQSADQQGTPLAGLAVLRQSVFSTISVPTIVPTAVSGQWVGFGEDLQGILKGAPAVASWGPDRLDVFVRGTDDALWHNAWNGSNWSGWGSLDGILSSSPAAVSWGPNRIDVFALGTTRHLWQMTWDISNWSGWIDLGAFNDPDGIWLVQGDPAVTSLSPGSLELFLGYSNDGNEAVDSLSHQTWNLSSLSGSETVGPATSSASAVAREGKHLDVVTRGPEGQVYYYQWDGTWQGPIDLGGYSVDAPAITSWGPDRLDLLIRDEKNELLHKFWNGSVWSEWQYVGGPIYSAPAAVSWGPQRIDVFAQGEKGHLVHYWFAR